MSTGITITGGTIIDPSQGIETIADLRISCSKIDAIGTDIAQPGDFIVNAAGYIVAPGLVDLHVHLREPGFEYKETIETGTRAAAAGGFTTVCCMPNTDPALDSVETLNDLQQRVRRSAHVRVKPIAAISKGRQGLEPLDYDALVAAGAAGFSDDGDSTLDSEVMLQVLKASKRLNVPVMVHCEDRSLATGAMHEGEVSAALGIPGIPAAAEESFIARDIHLAEISGGWLHVQHVSTGLGAALVWDAKERGVSVTAEVMPHHLLMTDAWVAGDRTLVNVDEPPGVAGTPGDPDTKVNPPLRPAADAEALLLALQQGVFDIVATDHAPHACSDKQEKSFVEAAMGINGSEMALPMILALVRANKLSLNDVIDLMSCRPATMLGDGTGTLRPGSPADVVVFDPALRWRVTEESLHSRSKNTPLLGMTLTGKPLLTFCDGVIKYDGR